MELQSKPLKVRGLGNVVDLKSSEDCVCNHSVVDDSTVTISGKEYNIIVMSNAGSPTRIYRYDGSVYQQGVSGTITFYLQEDTTYTALSNASVSYYVDDTLTSTGTTGSNGLVSFTVPTTNYGEVKLLAKYNGDSNYNKCSTNLSVIVQRKVNYSLVVTHPVTDIDLYTVTCVTNDTNEPVDNVQVQWFRDGSYATTDYTDSDGICRLAYTGSSRPSSVTCTLTKDDHYFVEVNE